MNHYQPRLATSSHVASCLQRRTRRSVQRWLCNGFTGGVGKNVAKRHQAPINTGWQCDLDVQVGLVLCDINMVNSLVRWVWTPTTLVSNQVQRGNAHPNHDFDCFVKIYSSIMLMLDQHGSEWLASKYVHGYDSPWCLIQIVDGVSLCWVSAMVGNGWESLITADHEW